MVDEPLTLSALAKFHRDVVLPDIQLKARVDALQEQIRAIEDRLDA